MEPRTPDPTALSDHAWDLSQHLLLAANPGGHPETSPTRESLEALCDSLRGERCVAPAAA